MHKSQKPNYFAQQIQTQILFLKMTLNGVLEFVINDRTGNSHQSETMAYFELYRTIVERGVCHFYKYDIISEVIH